MTSTFPPLAQAVAGALGAAVANIGAYPLDLATTRLQTARGSKRKRTRGIYGLMAIFRETVRKNGTLALFDGLESDTSATLISGFFYYYAYSFFRSQLIKRKARSSHQLLGSSKTPVLHAAEELAVGFFAGIASRLVSSPLSMVTVRLQSSEEEENDAEDDESGTSSKGKKGKKTVTSVVRDIYDKDGLLGFWTGFKTTILLCSNPAITLFLFQAFRRFLPAKTRQNPTPIQGFIGGALSNSIAVCILYPLMLAKTRAQVLPGSASGRNLVSILKNAYNRDGLSGLYQGLEAQVLKGFLSQGLTIMVKQRIECVMLYLYLQVRSS